MAGSKNFFNNNTVWSKTGNVKKNKYIIEMIDIDKKFGHVHALKQITLKVPTNAVFALVGENGAGKSTLMSVLFGLYEADNGYIRINNYEIKLKNVDDARKAGVGMVQQHFQLVHNLSIWRNIALGCEIPFFVFWIDKKQIMARIKSLMQKYDLYVPLHKKVKNVSVAVQQKVEILKILYRDCSIIIFDEPTSVLFSKEIDNFLNLVRKLKAEGKTIIYIAHHLKQVFAVADYIGVLRRGECVFRVATKQTSISEITTKMFPDDAKKEHINNNLPFTIKKDTQPVLKMRNLLLKVGFARTTVVNIAKLEVYPGEIVGIAGINDNGQNELADMLIGIHKPTSGQIYFQNILVNYKSIYARQHNYGLAKIPGDRWNQALLKEADVINNFLLSEFRSFPFSHFTLLNMTHVRRFTEQQIEHYQIHGADKGFAKTALMSGGNQQKVILARALSRKFDLLLLVQPTRGLDVNATQFIYEKIFQAKKAKKAVLLISYDLNEIVHLSDRVVILSKGSLLSRQFTTPNIKTDEIAFAIVNADKYQPARK